MDEVSFLQLVQLVGPGGAGVMLAVYIMERFGRKTNDSKFEDRFRNVEQQIKDLHDWHNVQDQDGVKVWYVRRSLEEAIVKLSAAVEGLAQKDATQNVILERLVTVVERLENQMATGRRRDD